QRMVNGFVVAALPLALPTTSPSPRLGSTLPPAGECSQRMVDGFVVAACGWRCQPLHPHLA
ncbi:hypothetical protein, partial [Stieleria bergensis]|uniref:hypothetical protein n=1 Tax=Stieleria bergensis TaxID=2528025 RepID=UPI003AF3819D